MRPQRTSFLALCLASLATALSENNEHYNELGRTLSGRLRAFRDRDVGAVARLQLMATAAHV